MAWSRKEQEHLAAAGMLAAINAVGRAVVTAALVAGQDWTLRTDRKKLIDAMRTLNSVKCDLEAGAVPACMIDADILSEAFREIPLLVDEQMAQSTPSGESED
jgi:hypothetical protein